MIQTTKRKRKRQHPATTLTTLDTAKVLLVRGLRVAARAVVRVIFMLDGRAADVLLHHRGRDLGGIGGVLVQRGATDSTKISPWGVGKCPAGQKRNHAPATGGKQAREPTYDW